MIERENTRRQHRLISAAGRSLLFSGAATIIAVSAVAPARAAEGFVSDRVFTFPVCPIGDENKFVEGEPRAIGAGLLGLARVFAPRVLNRTLRGAANGLRKLAGDESKTATAEATEHFRFYHIHYDDNEERVTANINKESRCIIFVRGPFGDPDTMAGDFGPIMSISDRYGRTGPALGRLSENGKDIVHQDEDGNPQKVVRVEDYAKNGGENGEPVSDNAETAHEEFFAEKYSLVAPPHLYVEASLDPSDDGYFVVTPRVVWYTEKIGNRRDKTRDLAFTMQFDNPAKASGADNPGTFANAVFGFEQLEIGSALGPAELAGLRSSRLTMRDLPSNLVGESKWAKTLDDAETKFSDAKLAIATGKKSKIILDYANTDLDERFTDGTTQCQAGSVSDRAECLGAAQLEFDAIVELLQAKMDANSLPSCTGFSDAAQKESCEIKRDKYAAIKTKTLHEQALAEIRKDELEIARDEARIGYGKVGPVSVTVSVTETRDVNKLLIALADIISPAEQLSGLTQQQVGDVQTAIFQLPPTKADQTQIDTQRNTDNQEYQLALLAISQKERELKKLKDQGAPEADLISVEEALIRHKLEANVAAAKLGVSPPYPDLLPPG